MSNIYKRFHLVLFDEVESVTLPCQLEVLAEFFPDEIDEVSEKIRRFTKKEGKFWVFKKEYPGKVRINLMLRKGHSYLDIAGFYSDDDLQFDIIENNFVKKLAANTKALIPFSSFYEKGFKARWIVFESGGGYTNTGKAIVIASNDGQPLKPLFVIKRGDLACKNHAAFAVWEGQSVVAVVARHHRGDFQIEIKSLHGTLYPWRFEEKTLWSASHLYKSTWRDALPKKIKKFERAIEAAIVKAKCYHCREPHFIRVD